MRLGPTRFENMDAPMTIRRLGLQSDIMWPRYAGIGWHTHTHTPTSATVTADVLFLPYISSGLPSRSGTMCLCKCIAYQLSHLVCGCVRKTEILFGFGYKNRTESEPSKMWHDGVWLFSRRNRILQTSSDVECKYCSNRVWDDVSGFFIRNKNLAIANRSRVSCINTNHA